jgi:hypothetical protein
MGRAYEDAIRVLLEGTSGVNAYQVAKATGLSHVCVLQFCRRETTPQPDTVERLGWFVWRRSNVHVLLSEGEVARATSGE